MVNLALISPPEFPMAIAPCACGSMVWRPQGHDLLTRPIVEIFRLRLGLSRRLVSVDTAPAQTKSLEFKATEAAALCDFFGRSKWGQCYSATSAG